MAQLYVVILYVTREDSASYSLRDARASSDRHHGYSDAELLDHAHPRVVWELMEEGIYRYSLQVLASDANVKERILVQLLLLLHELQHEESAHHPENALPKIQLRTIL